MVQTVGSRADSLVLRISQDAYQGSAQFTVRVDGAQTATTMSHGPTDYDAGGMNNVIGVLNNPGSTSLTIGEVEYSPL